MIIWKKKLIRCCRCHKGYSFDDNLFYHLKEYILICPNCNLMHKVTIQLLGKEYEGLKKIDKLNLTAITIGSPAENKNRYTIAAYTYIQKENPADGTGTITSVEIYVETATQGLIIAIFENVGGNYFTARGHYDVGVATAGYHQYDVSLPVETGDYIGFYTAVGRLEQTWDEGGNQWLISGDATQCVNTEIGYNTSPRKISICGTGESTPTGWPHKWNGVTLSKWNGVVIEKLNGIT